jgi:hypothetical protein
MNNVNEEESYYNFQTDYYYNIIYSFNYKRLKRTYSKRHCPICFALIKKNNVVLNCTHNCCFKCFYKYITDSYHKRKIPKCFICRCDIDTLEIKDSEQKKLVQDIILPFDSNNIQQYYPNVNRAPGRKPIIWLIQTFLYVVFMFIIYDLIVNAKNMVV